MLVNVYGEFASYESLVADNASSMKQGEVETGTAAAKEDDEDESRSFKIEPGPLTGRDGHPSMLSGPER